MRGGCDERKQDVKRRKGNCVALISGIGIDLRC